MRRVEWFLFVVIALELIACSSFALNDPHWVLDPPAHNLRGKTAADDQPESPTCDPVKKPDGTVSYQCVVHTFAAYKDLLLKIDQLETELKACQQGR